MPRSPYDRFPAAHVRAAFTQALRATQGRDDLSFFDIAWSLLCEWQQHPPRLTNEGWQIDRPDTPPSYEEMHPYNGRLGQYVSSERARGLTPALDTISKIMEDAG